MLLSIFTAAELQVICLIFSQCRPKSDAPVARRIAALASALKSRNLISGWRR
jgi:hypothetical protein